MKLKTLLAALLLAGFAINTKAQTTDEDLDAKYATSLVQPGTVAPDFTMNTPDGKPFSLSSLKGKTVVRLYNEYHSDKVEFVGVSMDTNVEAWQKAINQYGISYPQVSELKKFKETDISKAYGVQWIPSMVVVSPEGKILLSTVQYQKVEKLLKGINK